MFLQDVMCEKLLKLVDFYGVIEKYKGTLRGRLF